MNEKHENNEKEPTVVINNYNAEKRKNRPCRWWFLTIITLGWYPILRWIFK